MDWQLLISQLKRHEGLRLSPYRDGVGKLTVGYGRNLDDVGISIEEAEQMLAHDTLRVVTRLAAYETFGQLDDVRKVVVANMAFYLGVSGLFAFHRMWSAIEQQDWEGAAQEMLDSKWARQVGRRAKELSELMRTGKA